MTAVHLFRAIGLMSGTSMDGIDAAVVETDGHARLCLGPHITVPYPPGLRQKLLGLSINSVDAARAEQEVTDLHCHAVQGLCAQYNIDLSTIDIIGFHGQTVRHDPLGGVSWQLGDGHRMANTLGRRVVTNFRQNDIDNGGQGAPLAPVYHQALVRACAIREPIAVLNIGGVSNVTLIYGDLLHACDCGPGNALIDDWVGTHYRVPYDENGKIAAAGRIDQQALQTLLSDDYFRRQGPKSLDRNTFSVKLVRGLSPPDGAATLTAFTAAAIAAEAQRLPCTPHEWIVVGGGRRNAQLMSELRHRLEVPVRVAEDVGWVGEAIEAQAFGYLAVRSLLKLPLSWSGTTGVREPVTGGVCWKPDSSTRAVLLDLDGTLVDTAPDMVGALNDLRCERNLEPVPFEQARRQVSHGAKALVRLGFPEAKGAAFDALRERFLEIYSGRLCRETSIYEGVLEALARLESHGIAWGIVTNKPRWLTEPLLEQLALHQRAKVVVSGDSVRERKPHPAPLLHAAERLGIAPECCIYIGDAERDVLAARAAGMKVFVALFGYIGPDEQPKQWPATGWLETPQEMSRFLTHLTP